MYYIDNTVIDKCDIHNDLGKQFYKYLYYDNTYYILYHTHIILL